MEGSDINTTHAAITTISAAETSGTDVCSSSTELPCVTTRLWQVVTPFIIIIGLLGNLLVVIVFNRLHFSRSTTLMHLFVLALTDSIVMCLGPLRYWIINVFDYDVRLVSSAGCKLHLFLLYLSLDFSAWILVSVTVERALCVLRPLHVRSWFTVRRTLYRLLVIFVCLCLVNGHYFVSNAIVAKTESGSSFPETHSTLSLEDSSILNESGVNVNTTICPNCRTTNHNDPNNHINVQVYDCDSVSPEWEEFEEMTFVYIDLCFNSLVPFVIMLICNSFIIVSLRKSARTRPRSTSGKKLSCIQDSALSPGLPSVPESRTEQQDLPETSSQNSDRAPNMTELFTQPASTRETATTHPRPSSGASRDSVVSRQSVTTRETDASHSHRSSRGSRLSVVSKQSTASSDSATPHSRCSSRDSKDNAVTVSRGVTRMLILVTTVFVVTTLPSALYYIVDSYVRESEQESRTNQILDLVQVVTNLLQFCNYSCNFLLYTYRSKPFRLEVKYMLGLGGSRFPRHFESSVLSRSRQTYNGSHRRGSRGSTRTTTRRLSTITSPHLTPRTFPNGHLPNRASKTESEAKIANGDNPSYVCKPEGEVHTNSENCSSGGNNFTNTALDSASLSEDAGLQERSTRL